MSSSTAIKSCLDVLRRSPPEDSGDIIKSLSSLLRPNDGASSDLLRVTCNHSSLLGHMTDPEDTGSRPFVTCHYNRDGCSYRSPWSNSYTPPLDGEEPGMKPSGRLREIEARANEVFDCYRELYYGSGSVSSVYLQDGGGKSEGQSSFSGAFLIKKELAGDRNMKRGYWNAVHLVDVGPTVKGKAIYNVSTTISVHMEPADWRGLGETKIGGTLTKQVERSCPVTLDTCHVENMGKMVEEMEIDLRAQMESLHIGKTKAELESIRKQVPLKSSMQRNDEAGKELVAMLNQVVLGTQKKP